MTTDGSPAADIGSVVRVRWDQTGEEDEYTLVTPIEEDFTQRRISAATPFAAAVRGRHAGEQVAVRGIGQRCSVTILAVAEPAAASR
jgi:transcription elongation GreA/GreB family factor